MGRTSSVMTGTPRSANAAAVVDLPPDGGAATAMARPWITTALACSASVPRRRSTNARIGPSRYAAVSSRVDVDGRVLQIVDAAASITKAVPSP